MRILLTGASSMTGMAFAARLAESGHQVFSTFTRSAQESYGDDLRGQRVARVLPLVDPVFGCRFGDELFLRTIRDQRIEAVCHHGADVTDYKSPDFDPIAAVAGNTHELVGVLRSIGANGGRVVLTGSVFEGAEGAGSDGLPHVSPYGLSKALTSAMFEYYAAREGVALGKFVIPNPFGPYEEPRFTNYLVRTWKAGETASVRTPLYVRDNVHSSLLAAAYEQFVATLDKTAVFKQHNPSGYVESQGAFAARFAGEMRRRLDLPCELELNEQTEFTEPRVRINTEPLDGAALGWDETRAWDELADFYLSGAGQPT